MASADQPSRYVKIFLAANLAGVIRGLRLGTRHLGSRLVQAFDNIDPLGIDSSVSESTLAQLASVPVKPIGEVVQNLPAVTIPSDHGYVDGALPIPELICLLALLRDRHPSAVLEIGTYFGTTTRALALNAPTARVHTVDLPVGFNAAGKSPTDIQVDDVHLIQQREVGKAFRNDPSITNIEQHFADSSAWDFSPVKGADFFYIDGSHTYEYVKNDTEKCLLVASVKSTLIWHDFDEVHPGVVRYIAELRKAGYPVVRIANTSLAIMDYTRVVKD